MKQDLVSKTLLDIEQSIGSLDGKVDGINQRLDKINGTIISHEKRLNLIENRSDTMGGEIRGITVIGSIIAIVVSIITLLNHLL